MQTLVRSLYLLPLLSATPALAQDFDQLTRPVATIADSTRVQTMLSELLIAASGPVSRAEVVDVTGNGFGPDDLIILHPSLESFLVGSDVPAALQEAMKTWELEADYRLDATIKDSQDISRDAHSQQDAKAALMGAVLSAVDQYYQGNDMDMRLEQDSAGVSLEMWNYDPGALQYRLPRRSNEPLPVHDDYTQRFRFARPHFVMAFRDPSDCIEVYRTKSTTVTKPC